MVLIACYILGFALSWGPIAWVLIGEIFPLSVRGIGSSFGFRCQLAGQFRGLPVLPHAAGHVRQQRRRPVHHLWRCSALSIPFVLRFVPETKGKSLEQIEEEMVRR